MCGMKKCRRRSFEWQGWGLLLLALVMVVTADIAADTEALIALREAVDPNGKLVGWYSANVSVCLWPGVKCSAEPRVWELRLPGSGLVGAIPAGSLGKLDQLRVVSLRSNRLNGSLPQDLANSTHLKSLYLQNNFLSGSLPSNFAVWPRLVHLDFSSNQFSGAIPESLSSLKNLLSLYMQNNELSGNIPDINLPSLGATSFSVANNNLSGPIPPKLAQTFPASAFAGNAEICGSPTNVACPSPVTAGSLAAPSPSSVSGSVKHKKGLSTGAIVAIVVGGTALLLLIIFVILFWFFRRRGHKAVAKSAKGDRGLEKSEDFRDEYSTSMVEAERSKLVFFEGKRYTFDLEDLLRASAEVLGKGSVGTAYKAVLEDGSIVAVKRLKDVSTSRKDFETQIELIGKLQHRNLLPMRAYYFSKDEKLLVYDYMPAGSLSALLHGTKGGARTPLDWITRVRIALGAARGIAYLHDQHRFVHGNIKSSNVLLTRDLDSCVSDFGLAQLLSSSTAASRIVGYRAPEVLETRRVTPKADVYSFGVLLLELLTGKAPTQSNLNDEGIDLPKWVQSVVREEWTAEVFDLELMRYPNIEEEMVQMLQIAMQCVAQVPDQRPTMDQVVKLLEEVRPFSDGGDDGSRQFDSSAEKSKDFDSYHENPSEVYSYSESFTPSTSFQA